MTQGASVHATALGDVLREQARSRPGCTAVLDGEHRSTYRELDRRVNRLSRVLDEDGVRAGDRVAWLGQGSFRVLELLLAAAKLGAALAPLNWRSSVDEATGVVADLDPAVVVWQEEEVGALAAGVAQRFGTATWIRHDTDAPDGYEARLAAVSDDDLDRGVDPSSGVLVVATAAFDGRPRGAVLSHDALLAHALVMALVARVDERTVFLNSGPLFHVADWMWALPTFVLGGTNVYVRRVDPEELCRVIEAQRCTAAFLMPPTVEQMVDANAGGRFDLSSLRAPSGPAAWNAMVTVDDSPLATRRGGYGQTETMGLATFAALAPTGEGGAGRPAPLVQVRVVDPDGGELDAGEVGELVVRGPTVMAGYHAAGGLDRSRHVDGWHHTRDLGRREPDGSLTFVGPMTRIIKSAAENVYPAEVEACLRSHPDVVDCAVIGVPDATWGQRVKAVVVRAGELLDEEALVAHCSDRIASYKKPAHVDFVDEIPRAEGRVDYDALDERHGGGGYPGEGP